MLNRESLLPVLFYPELGLIFAWETSLMSSIAFKQWGQYVFGVLPSNAFQPSFRSFIKSTFYLIHNKYQFLKYPYTDEYCPFAWYSLGRRFNLRLTQRFLSKKTCWNSKILKSHTEAKVKALSFLSVFLGQKRKDSSHFTFASKWHCSRGGRDGWKDRERERERERGRERGGKREGEGGRG